ncbi:MAG: hypothetical protein UT48_C0023G0004 [Parcubacteria group bacterium GW2011_GWE2_39_37]|uniref:Uncharacterized protein n=1 Tax=Candidatus Falkowbacteria bacterium GW2011_GWF2_39_8 TaxID=1618642 RepID=A0A0G0PVP2_9BACT|nr:MAG: hypothetical protein UT48_C0023G0004 [Parcubacteria group bacterium GW2011_GWE2_39_37]KKR31998.1 MAG: hypothetical protein UT64_C0045G0007 [Candidatus Falkowbacteria bacterium GW2011_GWF2_39_8]
MSLYKDITSRIQSILFHIGCIEIVFDVPVDLAIIRRKAYIAFLTNDSTNVLGCSVLASLEKDGQNGIVKTLRLHYPVDDRITTTSIKKTRIHFLVGRRKLVKWFSK